MDVFDRVKMATVAMAIVHERGKAKPFTILGSGFCIHPRGIIVTCEHVLSEFMDKSVHQYIADAAKIDRDKGVQILGPARVITPYAIFYNTKVSRKRLIAIPSRVDISMIKTNYDLGMVRLHPHPRFRRGYPFLEIEDYGRVQEGMEIATCGFPLGTRLQDQLGTVTSSFTKGIVSSIIPSPGVSRKYLKGFQLNITAAPGNSGGPVFSVDTGKVFGVLQLGVQDQEGRLLPGIIKAEPIYPVFDHDSLRSILSASVGQIPSRPKPRNAGP